MIETMTADESKTKEIIVHGLRLLAASTGDGKSWVWPATAAKTVQHEAETRRRVVVQSTRRLFSKFGSKSGKGAT